MVFYRKVAGGYRLNQSLLYSSKRYNKLVALPADYFSDGATGAFDIFSLAWWVHDILCDKGVWMDGSRCTNWQASRVLSDILWREKRYFRSVYWLFTTFLVGGGKARENGMIFLKKEQSGAGR